MTEFDEMFWIFMENIYELGVMPYSLFRVKEGWFLINTEEVQLLLGVNKGFWEILPLPILT